MSAESPLNDHALNTLFHAARTYSKWLPQDVPDVLLKSAYDLAKMGPTSANMCPARFVFVRSPAAKEKLKPYLDEGNIEKTMTAPVTVIIAHDLEFYEKLPKLFPQTDARSWFADAPPEQKRNAAFRNGTLQAAYFMLAARALSLDCGPMSGFNPAAVKTAFFGAQNVEVNFLCNLGYGDPASLHPRNPRLDFDQVAHVV